MKSSAVTHLFKKKKKNFTRACNQESSTVAATVMVANFFLKVTFPKKQMLGIEIYLITGGKFVQNILE